MKRIMITAVVLLLSAGLTLAAPHSGQVPSPQSGTPVAAPYEDSVEGLQKLLADLQAAVKNKDQTAFEKLAGNLKLPEPAQWFARVFGSVEGSNLVIHYAKSLPTYREDFWRKIQAALNEGRSVFQVEGNLPTTPVSETGVNGALRKAIMEPVVFYDVSTVSPNGKGSHVFGYFFFVEGTFRFVDYGVFYWLSNFTPRIRVGGQIMAKKIISQARPPYPQAAKDLRIQGTVRMQAVISTDGRVAELTLLSGDSYLADAAMEAVRLWRYQPTLLNGRPVEVVTTIDVIFTLSY